MTEFFGYQYLQLTDAAKRSFELQQFEVTNCSSSIAQSAAVWSCKLQQVKTATKNSFRKLVEGYGVKKIVVFILFSKLLD